VAALDVAGGVVELELGLLSHPLIAASPSETASSTQIRTTLVKFINFILINGLLRGLIKLN
jgi:hypothetical protein